MERKLSIFAQIAGDLSYIRGQKLLYHTKESLRSVFLAPITFAQQLRDKYGFGGVVLGLGILFLVPTIAIGIALKTGQGGLALAAGIASWTLEGVIIDAFKMDQELSSKQQAQELAA